MSSSDLPSQEPDKNDEVKLNPGLARGQDPFQSSRSSETHGSETRQVYHSSATPGPQISGYHTDSSAVPPNRAAGGETYLRRSAAPTGSQDVQGYMKYKEENTRLTDQAHPGPHPVQRSLNSAHLPANGRPHKTISVGRHGLYIDSNADDKFNRTRVGYRTWVYAATDDDEDDDDHERHEHAGLLA